MPALKPAQEMQPSFKWSTDLCALRTYDSSDARATWILKVPSNEEKTTAPLPTCKELLPAGRGHMCSKYIGISNDRSNATVVLQLPVAIHHAEPLVVEHCSVATHRPMNQYMTLGPDNYLRRMDWVFALGNLAEQSASSK